MSNRRVSDALHYVRHLIAAPSTEGLPDGQLLEEFAARGNEAAFTALVRRHGAMVAGVCRRLLADPNDVEDAFQATFLVLLCKARALGRRELVGNWLHGVAHRVALKLRTTSARRTARQVGVETLAEFAGPDESAHRDLRLLLDEEVRRLPQKYRAPVILCYLEGRSNEEAARQLQWPAGTVKCRLARARNLLRTRLTRRGITLGAATLTAALAVEARATAWPVLSTDLLTPAALSSLNSSRIVTLAEGVLKAMWITKVKFATAAVVVAVLLGGGATALVQRAGAEGNTATIAPAAVTPARPLVSAQPPTVPPAPIQQVAAAPESKKADPPEATIESLWADLASNDEVRVYRAILGLAATPQKTLPFFKDRLRPIKAEAKRVNQLLADLDSGEFASRQRAEEELEYLGKYARPYLRKALTDKPSAEMKQRLERLVKRLPYDPMDEAEELFAKLRQNPKDDQVRQKLIQVLSRGNSNPVMAYNQAAGFGGAIGLAPTPAPAPAPTSPMWLRAKRAVAVLEHMGNPEAKIILEKLVEGEPDALPTKEAKAALERLGKRAGTP